MESNSKEYQQNKPTDIWKKKNTAERDESLVAQRAERAKNGRMKFAFHLLLEAHAIYQREEEQESDVPENKATDNSAVDGPSSSVTSVPMLNILQMTTCYMCYSLVIGLLRPVSIKTDDVLGSLC
ncbi:hypothetical protein V6N13_148998 [Hibiscus sabdariffa]